MCIDLLNDAKKSAGFIALFLLLSLFKLNMTAFADMSQYHTWSKQKIQRKYRDKHFAWGELFILKVVKRSLLKYPEY